MRLTNEQRKDICDRYQAGESADVLKTVFSVSLATIYNTLKHFNIKTHKVNNWHSKMNSDDLQSICSQYKNGVPSTELAHKLGVDVSTVLSILRKEGVKIRTPKELHSVLTNEDKNLICSLYSKNHNSTYISEQFGVSPLTIINVLKRRGIARLNPKEKHRKFTLDETVFDTINEGSAYWIGFLMADGNVYRRKGNSACIGVNLQSRDVNHLKKLRDFLRSDYKIAKSHGGNGVLFRVHSDRIADVLAAYGIVPRKSHITKAPQILINNRHFWRGVIDGDGAISIINVNGFEIPSISLTGSLYLMEQFNAYLKRLVPKYRAKIGAVCDSFRVATNGRHAIKLIDVLYNNSNIYLDRKKEKAQYIIDLGEGMLNPRNGNAKLTDDIVVEIKKLHRDIGVEYKDIACRFGVTLFTIRRIFEGKTWKHVTI